MNSRSGFFLVLIATLLAASFLLIAPLLQYVLAAGLLAVVLYPVQTRLVSQAPWMGPRLSALVLTSLIFVAAIVPLFVLTLIIFDSILALSNRVTRQRALDLLEELRDMAIDLGVAPEDLAALEQRVLEELSVLAANLSQRLINELIGLFETTIRTSVGILILLFVLYYLLVDGTALLAWLKRMTPVEADALDTLFEEVETVTWAVVGSHLLVAVVEGILGGIGLWLVGIPNATFWTLIMIVLSVLPVIGVWLIWGPAVGWLVLTGEPTAAAFLALYGIAVLSVVDNYLRAIFVDRGAGLHPAVVLVGVLGGLYLMGVIGLFLGPVLLAVLKATITTAYRVNPELLADETG